ncbi:MAG: hypothetical protein ABGZ23_13245 [Fuerstiella sp.]
MKKILLMAIATLPITLCSVGCGGAPETDAATQDEAQKLDTDAAYEKEMMGEMGGTAEK